MTPTIHVLLIDDSDEDVALIVQELREAGIAVAAERVDSSEALEQALSVRRWDVVLADNAMPSLDVFRALEMVRGRDPEVSFIVVTGTMGEDLAVKAMRAGAQDYVPKDRLARLGPVVERELLEADVRRERARVIEALRDSEARKAAILEAALDAVITMDHHGDVVDLNAAAERMFGYRQQDVVGKEMAELIIPPSLRDAHRQGLARYLETGEGPALGKRIEFPAMRRDGSEFPAEIAITRIVRSGPPMFTGFIRDVTERKRLEARERLLAETGAILVKSLECATMLQGVAELVVGQLADWCGVELLDDRGELQRVAVARRATAEDRRMELPAPLEVPVSIPLRAIREATSELGRDGAVGAGSYLVVPLIARGRPLGTMTLVRAPGERSYGPDDVDLLEELAARCATAVDNAKLFAQVRESVRVRDEFIAIAAHELRTPLTPLRMQAEALATKVASKRSSELTPERLATPMRHIVRSSERLVALVERLLDFSQMTVGGSRLELEELDLAMLAAEVVDELASELERVSSTVVWNTSREPVVGRWDRHRLKLAIQNLLANAVKFAPGKPIEVSVRADQAHARLAVRDRGPGLRHEEQAQIFERYERPAPLWHYGGFGLGLWIVQQVAREHGGRVELWSEPGEGAEFTLLLPRDPPLLDAEQPAL
ncbi:MAG TPA: PAS domain S-box protein [Kofleriaceae bacterium]|nr:PAS domain S-box protein [Kofleriaceae bacterium]